MTGPKSTILALRWNLAAIGLSATILAMGCSASFWLNSFITSSTALDSLSVHIAGGVLLVLGFVATYFSLRAGVRSLIRHYNTPALDLFNYGQEKED